MNPKTEDGILVELKVEFEYETIKKNLLAYFRYQTQNKAKLL